MRSLGDIPPLSLVSFKKEECGHRDGLRSRKDDAVSPKVKRDTCKPRRVSWSRLPGTLRANEPTHTLILKSGPAEP